MVAIAGSDRFSIDENQRFRMAEVVCISDGQIKTDVVLTYPLGGNTKCCVEKESEVIITPIAFPWDEVPALRWVGSGKSWLGFMACSFEVKGWQGISAMINKRLNEFQSLRELTMRPADVVEHG